MVEDDNLECEPHPAIMLVSAADCRGLILEPYEVSSKTNEITAEFIKMITQRIGVCN